MGLGFRGFSRFSCHHGSGFDAEWQAVISTAYLSLVVLVIWLVGGCLILVHVDAWSQSKTRLEDTSLS